MIEIYEIISELCVSFNCGIKFTLIVSRLCIDFMGLSIGIVHRL